MSKLSKYFDYHLFSSFLTFFIPLFGISSIIFFIKIVSLTSVVHITFFDLLKLYLFTLPQILFFTLPIALFAASIASLYKLSFEYEMISLFSIAISPWKIFFILFKRVIFLSLLTLIIGFVLVPQAKQLYKGFIIYKKNMAKLNIKPAEFGHKFGNWYLFMKDKKNNIFIDIALYQYHPQKENFIIAKKATIENRYGLQLILYNGKSYQYHNHKLSIINFKKMILHDQTSQANINYTNFLNYWLEALHNKKRAYDLISLFLIASFPLLSLFYIFLLGITNPRMESKKPYLNAFLLTLLYMGMAFSLAKILLFKIFILILLWVVVGGWLFYKLIVKRF